MKEINIKSMSISTILTIILITFMTIYGELSANFMNILKGLTGQHWVTKSVVSVAFFMLSYFILNFFLSREENEKKNVNYVVLTTVICGLIILLFFVYKFFA